MYLPSQTYYQMSEMVSNLLSLINPGPLLQYEFQSLFVQVTGLPWFIIAGFGSNVLSANSEAS